MRSNRVRGLLPAASLLLAFLLAYTTPAAPPAPKPVSVKPVSYARQIQPVLQKNCYGCHNGPDAASGYAMATRDALLKGGRHGAAIVVGKGKDSNFVRYLTGDLQPKMPPGGALDLETVGVVRRWIDEGAKFDGGTVPAVITAPVRPNGTAAKGGQPAPVTALTYSPDGLTLAAGGYTVVRLLDPATGAVTRTLPGSADQVQSLAWSHDGKKLAAAGGPPGAAGEVIVFDVQTGKIARTLTGHGDVIYGVAFSPDGAKLATASLDKTVKLWDAATGKVITTLKDHADAVLSVAFSPDGKWLATASADRSAKLFDTTSWKRVAGLTAHNDAVTCVAFSPDSTLLATASADKTIKLWRVEPGKMENPLRTLYADDALTDCVWSGDGALFACVGADSRVRFWNADGGQGKGGAKETNDWLYSVAASKDAKTVVAGTQDGAVLFWNVADSKLLHKITLAPIAAPRLQTAGKVSR